MPSILNANVYFTWFFLFWQTLKLFLIKLWASNQIRLIRWANENKFQSSQLAHFWIFLRSKNWNVRHFRKITFSQGLFIWSKIAKRAIWFIYLLWWFISDIQWEIWVENKKGSQTAIFSVKGRRNEEMIDRTNNNWRSQRSPFLTIKISAETLTRECKPEVFEKPVALENCVCKSTEWEY